MKRKILIGLVFLALIAGFASAQSATVCCEKTISGLYCQDVPAAQCAADSRQVPTACRSTSYCKPGTCYDSNEGTCLDNTPQLVCNLNKGLWTDKAAPQCALGCCVLGDQAAFVSLVRCKRLAGFLGLETNYKTNIKDEASCVASVLNQEKGACVYTSDFQTTCRLTTRADCSGTIGGGENATAKGEFFKGKLCSAEELGTICGPTTKTACLPGKEEVYYLDSCGNPANIYDAAKYNDKRYWTDIMDKSQSCNPNAANANSATCGNCNYLAGSFCRKTSSGTAKTTYGTNICADLNCHNTANGKSYKHGESWCVNDDAGTIGKGDNSVGNRFYKHICINGEEVLEACADFRQQECIEDKITTTVGAFSQAACRVNRWQDCTAQTEKSQCENTDKRDCLWIESKTSAIKCIPQNTPGLKFWEGEEASAICAKANAACEVTYEKGLFGQETCVKNCDCIGSSWESDNVAMCKAMGDCGPKINWLGDKGYAPTSGKNVGKVGYTIIETKGTIADITANSTTK